MRGFELRAQKKLLVYACPATQDVQAHGSARDCANSIRDSKVLHVQESEI
jgi:hypothetical protein